MALYQGWDTADRVIEALLDAGFSHKDIALISGDFWYDELPDFYDQQRKENEVILQVLASDQMAKIARELICNSGPVDVREQEGDWEEGWVTSTPVAISYTIAR
jgi:hypothetical protein